MDQERVAKRHVGELALFGGSRLFRRPRSTSNLVRPSLDAFLAYLRQSHEAGGLTGEGPLVPLLERRLAQFHGTQHCVAVCSGFWALVLAIQALALPGRTEVLMPSLTYRRLADVVAWAGLVPHFCDVDPDSLAISPTAVASQISERTALIIGVHPIVNCCPAGELERLAARHGIPLLLDGVESVYEWVEGRKVGSFGRAECFSLHASKLLNGFEGGYITTNDATLAQRLARMRTLAAGIEPDSPAAGMPARMIEPHAAMALACLDDLPRQVKRNETCYRLYQRELCDIPGIRLLEFDESAPCSFKNIVVELTGAWPLTRADTLAVLNAEGVLARAYYSPPLHLKPTSYQVIAPALHATERLAEHFMLLPCGHHVDAEDVVSVCRLLAFLATHGTEIDARIQS